ncbi:MAG TPA: hypothetical protein DIW47_12230 [Bacteroidetes bacterium]|nr:hypothetical protein [Bacteroidota bacterium]
MSLRHFPEYLLQRFPPLAMLLFVILYLTVSTVAFAESGLTFSFSLLHFIGILACISFFFRLRVMDEIKDLKIDQAVHPERLVVQGKIRINELISLAAPGMLMEAAWSLWISMPAFIAWLIAVAYSFLMRYEFFMPRILEQRFFLYAFSHTLIMPLVVAWLWFAHYVYDGIHDGYLELICLAAVSFFGALAYEVARKTFASAAEPKQIQTYSKLLGRDVASRLSSLLVLINGIFLAFLFLSTNTFFDFIALSMDWLLIPLIMFLIVAASYTKAVRDNDERAFRLAEKFVSLSMLINYLLLIILLWMR